MPKLKIPTIFKVLNLGILPKIVLSVFGIAILILSFNFKLIDLLKHIQLTTSFILSLKRFYLFNIFY